MRMLVTRGRAARRALTVVGGVLLLGMASASAGPLSVSAGVLASASQTVSIQLVADRGWGGPAAPPGARPGYGRPGDTGGGGQPSPNWQADRYSPSMYDKRDAADWGAAAAAGAVGLDAIGDWAWRNSGPPPGYGVPYGMAPASTQPDPEEIGPREARPDPGSDSIGPPSPTRTRASGCYTLGVNLICPNN